MSYFLVSANFEQEWMPCRAKEAFLSGEMTWAFEVDGFTGGRYGSGVRHFCDKVVGHVFDERNGSVKYYVVEKEDFLLNRAR